MAVRKSSSKRSSNRPNKSLAPKAGYKPGHRYGKGGKMCKNKWGYIPYNRDTIERIKCQLSVTFTELLY